MDYTEDDVQGLAAKIETLTLEPGEQAALDALLDAAEAETTDVAGFASNPTTSLGGRIGRILVVSAHTTARPARLEKEADRVLDKLTGLS